ncbi:uncharacterized protein LOC129581104 [Paramacrobiotus metropolitanus]|uniref:uncharacterized protein LOC129581104 n=1 Tax=Paramacrobiotus metropolitanus TaxID=2943436 RepID=UPI002445C001|nr:uncharacterized protein LOC129581104 [Paramacrobiotus metropolitanus]
MSELTNYSDEEITVTSSTIIDKLPIATDVPMPLASAFPSGSNFLAGSRSKKSKSKAAKLPKETAGKETDAASSRSKKKAKAEPGTRKPRMLTMAQVTKKLQQAGVEDLDTVSHCVRVGIARHFIKLESAADLDAVLVSTVCDEVFGTDCKTKIDVTLKMVLRQKDNGSDEYYGGDDYAVRCSACNQGYYVNELCAGQPGFCDGKFMHHCVQCKKCVGDVRNDHCDECGKHYFAGSMGNFSCPCQDGFGRRKGGKGRKSGLNLKALLFPFL